VAADTPCGFKPLLSWSDIDGVKEFAEMLLDIYYICDRRQSDQEKLNEVGQRGYGKLSRN
jgi:hypothetical protein